MELQTPEPQEQQKQQTPNEHRNKGGRPPQPDAPTNADECRHLIAVEVVKTKPDQTRVRGLQALLESFERQAGKDLTDTAEKLTQSINEMTTLREETASLRGNITVLESRCDLLAVPHNAVEAVTLERDSLRHDLHFANMSLTTANKELKDAVTARDLARESQRVAEQHAAALKGQLDSAYMKLIDPVSDALRALAGATSFDARERRDYLELRMTEFRRMHALAVATPVFVPTTPVKIVRRATPAELEKATTDQTEAACIENAAQPRSIDPTAYESLRERAVPRAPEPEPTRPISGGTDWSPLVK